MWVYFATARRVEYIEGLFFVVVWACVNKGSKSKMLPSLASAKKSPGWPLRYKSVVFKNIDLPHSTCKCTIAFKNTRGPLTSSGLARWRRPRALFLLTVCHNNKSKCISLMITTHYFCARSHTTTLHLPKAEKAFIIFHLGAREKKGPF